MIQLPSDELFSNIFTTTLDNGLRVVVHSFPSPSVGFSAAVLTGPIWETPENSGISHFLEHAVFRGIPRYPSAKKLALALDKVGSDANAATFCDLTAFSQRLLPESVEAGMEIARDMLSIPVFEGIEVERNIILEECMEDIDEEGKLIAVDQLSSQLLYDSHPYSHPILGTRESVRLITRSMLKKHLGLFYRPENMVVTLSGEIDKNSAFEMANKVFGTLKSNSNSRPFSSEIAAVPKFSGPVLKVVKSPKSQINIRFSFTALPIPDPDFYLVKAIANILDSSSGSPLRNALQEKSGLCYSLGCGIDAYQKAGAVHIDLSVQPSRLTEAIEKTMKVFRNISKKGFSREENILMKEQYIKEKRFSSNDHWEFSGRKAMELLFDLPRTIKDEYDMFTAIPDEKLVEIARKVFGSENLGITLIGPVTKALQNEIAALSYFSNLRVSE
ncbi:MAG: insulinase family protein [Candidatus Riflebacteria bacterium]|nr:insulinase family protein [Candidatus Riflebacteria bacterium]